MLNHSCANTANTIFCKLTLPCLLGWAEIKDSWPQALPPCKHENASTSQQVQTEPCFQPLAVLNADKAISCQKTQVIRLSYVPETWELLLAFMALYKCSIKAHVVSIRSFPTLLNHDPFNLNMHHIPSIFSQVDLTLLQGIFSNLEIFSYPIPLLVLFKNLIVFAWRVLFFLV